MNTAPFPVKASYNGHALTATAYPPAWPSRNPVSGHVEFRWHICLEHPALAEGEYVNALYCLESGQMERRIESGYVFALMGSSRALDAALS